MSIILGRTNGASEIHTFDEPSLPTRPAGNKLCPCHGEPSYWRGATAGSAAGWRCAVEDRERRALRQRRMDKAGRDGHTRQDVWDASDGRCYLCGVTLDPARWNVDHVTPVALGGADIMENCRAACVDCNRSKGAQIYVLERR